MHAIPGAVSHDLKTGQWYVAKVMYRGSHFRVLFGNRQLFEASDDSLAGTPGKTGPMDPGRHRRFLRRFSSR